MIGWVSTRMYQTNTHDRSIPNKHSGQNLYVFDGSKIKVPIFDEIGSAFVFDAYVLLDFHPTVLLVANYLKALSL